MLYNVDDDNCLDYVYALLVEILRVPHLPSICVPEEDSSILLVQEADGMQI